MHSLSSLGLVDLLVAAFVLLAVLGALRAGRGLLSVAGAALGALVVAWLLAAGLTAWGSAAIAGEVRHSAFASAVPMPDRALGDLDRLSGPRP